MDALAPIWSGLSTYSNLLPTVQVIYDTVISGYRPAKTTDLGTGGISGIESTVLSNTNITLVPYVNKIYQSLSGTLSGPVVINLSRTSAVNGTKFSIRFNGVVISSTNSITIQENGTGSLIIYNTDNATLTGNLSFLYTGSAWVLFEEAIVETIS